MAKVVYTTREKTLKQVSVNHVLENARHVLAARGVHSLCVSAVRHMELDHMLTIEEGNKLLDTIVGDTHFYNY